MKWVVWLSGIPKPKGSWNPIISRSTGRVFLKAPTNTKIWLDHASHEIKRLWLGPLISDPVRVDLDFFLPKPKLLKRLFPVGRRDGDLDKQMRSILDVMTGVVYVDDSQVVDSCLSKRYGDEPGVKITISTMGL